MSTVLSLTEQFLSMSNEEVNRKNPLAHCFSSFYDTVLYRVQWFQFKWDKKKIEIGNNVQHTQWFQCLTTVIGGCVRIHYR